MQGVNPSPQPGASFDRAVLKAWMQCMEDYGQTWLEDIGKALFSQEYWYLFVITLIHHWRQAPLNISDACRSMKTGSSKTRENRLKKLIAQHWFIKIKDQTDLRRTHLKPTQDMLESGRRHFRRSLGQAVRFLADAQLLQDDLEPLLRRIAQGGEALDSCCLLPWAEYLVGYTNDWNSTFDNRFHTEEYWHPFVHCLRGCWAGRPLTMSEACQCMRTGSSRTREKRIELAILRGMLARQKDENDLRTTFILSTGALENALVRHFSRTLGGLQSLAGQLLAESSPFTRNPGNPEAAG